MELPKLPEPIGNLEWTRDRIGWIDDGFTEAQMQEYARQAVLMEREACAKVCEEWGAWNETAQKCAAAIRERA